MAQAAEMTVKVNVEMDASLTDVRLIEIIMRYDRLRRVVDREDAQFAVSSGVMWNVQYVEDLGHLLRALRVALPPL